MSINSKQFVICEEKVELENWTSIKLENFILSYSNELDVKEVIDGKNKRWLLLGRALQADSKKSSPIEELKKKKDENIESIYNSWTGRWILISNNCIHLDASGSLGCFYAVNTEKVYISSSPSILNNILKKYGIDSAEHTCSLRRGIGMDYYPAPATRYYNIKRLMASQILNFKGNLSIKKRRLLYVDKYKLLSYEEQLNLLKQYFSTAVINLFQNNEKNLYVPLTAGMDSRLILAACMYNKIPIKSVTFEQSNMIKADRTLPKIISNKLGIEHIFVNKSDKNFSSERVKEFDLHCGQHCIDADRELYAYRQFETVGDNSILLRGGGFETARFSYYHKQLEENKMQTPTETIIKTYNLYNSDVHKAAIEEWGKWIKENPESDVDWKCRFYLEERVGAWLSYLEYADDITNVERIHLANCTNIISLMLSIPIDKRKDGQYQIDLINKFEPCLTDYKINPKTLGEKVKGKINRIFNS